MRRLSVEEYAQTVVSQASRNVVMVTARRLSRLTGLPPHEAKKKLDDIIRLAEEAGVNVVVEKGDKGGFRRVFLFPNNAKPFIEVEWVE